MRKLPRFRCRGPLLAALLFASRLSAEDLPLWLKEAATQAHPVYSGKVKAVVLLKEEQVSADATGKQISTIRGVIKVLTQEGRREAIASVYFDEGNEKVREARGWTILPSGKVKEYGKKEAVDSAVVDVELYSSFRRRSIVGIPDCDPGSVFGYEITVESNTVFAQFQYTFQDDLPTLRSRFSLQVPPGWTAKATAFGGGNADAQSDGANYVWTMSGLPPWEPESHSPRLFSMLPRLAVSMLPPDGFGSTKLATFRNWEEVSDWKSQLMDKQADITAALEQKANELVAGKSAVLDQIRALAEFAQKVRYVAISTNLRRGGGYVPHTADQVLAKAYGDCKDKANLLRALLRVRKIESYLVSIYSGDHRYTRPEWPSPQQFNHAILAISVPEETRLPAALTHDKVGRILLFDPTDTEVPFGFLPQQEQGAYALLIAAGKGGLFRVPTSKPSDNHSERTVQVTVNDAGDIDLSFVDLSTGQESFDGIALQRRLSAVDYRKSIEAWLSRRIGGAQISKLASSPQEEGRKFVMEVALTAPNHVRTMQGRLMMLKPAFLGSYGTPNVNQEKRQLPLVIEPVSFHETVVVTPPANFVVDEIPTAVELRQPFGRYQCSWQHREGKIHYERTLLLERAVVDAKDYAQARDFFLQINGAESNPVVLVKKN